LLALPHPHLSLVRDWLPQQTQVSVGAANVFPFKRLPILPLLLISNGSWTYVIIPCITGASKPNERLYQNDRLHLLPLNGMRKGFKTKPFLKYHFTNSSRITPKIQKILSYQQYIHILNTKHNEISEINKHHISEVQALPGYRTSYTTICMHTCK